MVEAAGIEPASEINLYRVSTWLAIFTYTGPWWLASSIDLADSHFLVGWGTVAV